MDAALRDLVRERAGHRCEYCHLPKAAEPFFTYHIEHIVARQHGGGDDESPSLDAPERQFVDFGALGTPFDLD